MSSIGGGGGGRRVGGAGTKKRGLFNGYFFKERHQIRIQILFVKYLLDSLGVEIPDLKAVLKQHIKSLNKCLSNFSTLSVQNKRGCLRTVLFEVIDDDEEILKPAFMIKFEHWKSLAQESPRKWVAVPAGHYTKDIRMPLSLIEQLENIILGVNNQLMNKPMQMKGSTSTQRAPLPKLGEQFQAYYDDYRAKLKAYTLYLQQHKKQIDDFVGQTFIEVCAKTREEAFVKTYENYRKLYSTATVPAEKERLKALMATMKKEYQNMKLTEKPLKELYSICLESTKIFYALQYGFMDASGAWKQEWSVGLNAMYDVLMDKNFLLDYKEEPE